MKPGFWRGFWEGMAIYPPIMRWWCERKYRRNLELCRQLNRKMCADEGHVIGKFDGRCHRCGVTPHGARNE